MDVYFDYKELGDELVLGVVMKEEESIVLQQVKTIKKPTETNFYHWSLEAFRFAIELAVEDGDDEVLFKNQQEKIFTWLLNGNIADHYRADYKKIKDGLAKLNNIGVTLDFEVISGDKNVAKKYIRKQAKAGAVSQKGNLNSIFNDTNQNVVSFLRNARRRA